MCMSLYRIELILEKIFKKFLGVDFLAPKSSHRREKQPVLGPGSIYFIQNKYSEEL